MPTLSTLDVVPFAKFTLGSDKDEDKSYKIYLFPIIWLDATMSMIQVLGILKAKRIVGLLDCAMVAMDKDVICVGWSYWNIWYLPNFLSDISTFLNPEKVCPSKAWATWANWPTWEVLSYNFRHLFLKCPTSRSCNKSLYLTNFLLLHVLLEQNLMF